MAKPSNTGMFLTAGLGLAVLALIVSKKETVPGDKDKTLMDPKKFTGSATEFVVKTYHIAREAQKLFPTVPWQLFIAFSGLESGWGKSAPNFNSFGTKPGPAWKGRIQLLDTTEILPKATGYRFPVVKKVEPSIKYPGKYKWYVKDNFRAYNNQLDAFKDFGKFITSGRYKNSYKSKDIRSIVTGIWQAGYATDPGYVDKIMKLVGIIDQVTKKYFG